VLKENSDKLLNKEKEFEVRKSIEAWKHLRNMFKENYESY
jgi:hypothetical protein